MSQFDPLVALNQLTNPMLNALKAIGSFACSAEDLGLASASPLTGLVRHGLLAVDNNGPPTLYYVTPAGQAVLGAMHANVTPVAHEGDVSRIQRTVAAHFNIPAFEMTSARRARRVARPRQVAMYLARELTPKSLPDIGRRFGDRDHTTVLHGIRTVEHLMSEDVSLARDVCALKSLLCTQSVDNSHIHAFVTESAGA